MSKSLGSGATLDAGNDGVTWTKVGDVKKADFPFSNNAIDSTDNDDNGFKSNLYGDQMCKGTADVNYDPLDPGQALIIANAAAKIPTWFRYRARGAGTGLPQVIAKFIITEVYPPSEHEKTQEMPLKATSTGSVNSNPQ